MEFNEFVDTLSRITKWEVLKIEDGESFEVIVLTDDKRRKQKVIIDKINEGGYDIARFRTVIGNIDLLKGDRPIYALKLNSKFTFGSFAIDSDKLIIVDTVLLKNIIPEQIVASLLYVAEQADKYEKILLQEDRH